MANPYAVRSVERTKWRFHSAIFLLLLGECHLDIMILLLKILDLPRDDGTCWNLGKLLRSTFQHPILMVKAYSY